jgi:hypothetical protein
MKSWPPSIAPPVGDHDESNRTGEDRRGWFSLGFVLVVGELYLLLAAGVALTRGQFIAPPIFIFAVLHDWLFMSLVIVLVCIGEFLWKRNMVAGAVITASLLVALCGECALRNRFLTFS